METHRENRKLARSLAAWKQNIPVRFGTLSIKEIAVSGVEGETVTCGQPINIQVLVAPGEMNREEILAQFVFGAINKDGDYKAVPDILRLTSKPHNGDILFEGTYMAKSNGRFAYGVRIMPVTPGLASPLDSGLVLWGSHEIYCCKHFVHYIACHADYNQHVYHSRGSAIGRTERGLLRF